MTPRSAISNPAYLAVVSPCSACRNQLSSSTSTRPACPRRAIEQQWQGMQAAGMPTAAIEHLNLHGTEGTAKEGDGSYRNPVYSDDMHAILVWIALPSENAGIYDIQGNLLCPNLLDPVFDTSYIQCRGLPVVPRGNEALYFQNGAFQENDQLEVTLSPGQQMTTGLNPQPVLIAGSAQKINYIFNHPRTPLSKDLCPSGV